MNLKRSNSKNPSPRQKPALKAVCGFLNYHGGKYLLKRANDGTITGVEPTDHTLRKLSQQISSRIKPEITPDIRVIKEDEKSIIVVTVPEGNNKPYFLDGIAYVRLGTENKVIPPDELKRIILNNYSLPWDEQACHGATVNDIDQDAVRTFLKKANEERRCNINPELPLEISLDKLGIINNGIPTNAAVLFFGKEPQRFIIQSESHVVPVSKVRKSPAHTSV